jgi:hypothetical protein
MQPWFIATEPFRPGHPEWARFIEWSGLSQLKEVVFDPILCPTVLSETKAEYWPHIVNEDFMLNFFVDLEFLLGELPDAVERNLLCVFRNPVSEPPLPATSMNFEILGYDLVDVQASASALTNCGGFPEVFENSELSSKGLLTSCARALEVQSELRRRYPEEPHANCHVWAICRAHPR